MEEINGEWIKARLTGPRGQRAALARHVGWDSAKAAKVLNGQRRVAAAEIPKVMEFFDADAAVTRRTSDEIPGEPFSLIPVYDVEASAGPGLIPPDHTAVAYRLELPTSYLASLTESPPSALQVISVKGTSMVPTLKPGDLIIVDRAKTSLGYDGLFVLDVDDAMLVKRIGRSDRAGWVRIKSDNPDDDPFERRAEEVRVVGKVILRMVRE